jgi:pimeloyl-ACP methyl ester carboxylesterase
MRWFRSGGGLLAGIVGGAVLVGPVAGCSVLRGRASESSNPPPTVSYAPPNPDATRAPSPALARFYQQKVTWKSCGAPFECSTVTVPLNYQAPTGRTITLAVVRQRATGPGVPLGSLLVNPGGPGGSGIAYARQAKEIVSDGVRARYDVVGFDPRGVGASTPVRCLTDAELDTFVSLDGSPDTPVEEQALIAEAATVGSRCQERAGWLLAHVGTPDAARDMDVLRAVLGDTRLHLLGKSYGTYLGATYAGLFPRRVGRLVLDGALDPTTSGANLARGQTAGFEQALVAFVDDCLAGPNCPLDGDRNAAVSQVAQFVAGVDSRPLTGTDERKVTQSLVVLGIAAALYERKNGWPALRQALTEGLQGNGNTLLLLADLYTDRGDDGRYQSNQNEAQLAVNCLDHPDTATLAAGRARATELTAISPAFGAYLGWGAVSCADWPVPPASRPKPITAPGAAPILVVGTIRDPATPYRWAQALAAQLSSGVLLTYNGDGHTAYRQGDTCVDRTVDAYLLDGVVPADGTRCG